MADFVNSVEDVDDVEPNCGRLEVIPFELVRDARVDLRIEREVTSVGEVVSQTAPIDHVGAENASDSTDRRIRSRSAHDP